MSGFKDDVLAILRDNVLLHGEALGYILFGELEGETAELLEDLGKRKFPVTDYSSKPVILFDYIVIHREFLCLQVLMDAFSLASTNGIIIADISDQPSGFHSEYRSKWAGFTATKINYGDRYYLVFHKGADYGN